MVHEKELICNVKYWTKTKRGIKGELLQNTWLIPDVHKDGAFGKVYKMHHVGKCGLSLGLDGTFTTKPFTK